MMKANFRVRWNLAYRRYLETRKAGDFVYEEGAKWIIPMHREKISKEIARTRVWKVELTLTGGEVLEVYVKALTQFDAEEKVKNSAIEFKTRPIDNRAYFLK